MSPLLVSLDPDDLSRGVSIAIAGLAIVFTALLLLSLSIAALPKVLAVVHRVLPEVDHSPARGDHPESQVPDDEAVLAAIGYVLHTEFQRQTRA